MLGTWGVAGPHQAHLVALQLSRNILVHNFVSADVLQDVRSEFDLVLEAAALAVDVLRHEFDAATVAVHVVVVEAGNRAHVRQLCESQAVDVDHRRRTLLSDHETAAATTTHQCGGKVEVVIISSGPLAVVCIIIPVLATRSCSNVSQSR
jgi:hypothetical protein